MKNTSSTNKSGKRKYELRRRRQQQIFFGLLAAVLILSMALSMMKF